MMERSSSSKEEWVPQAATNLPTAILVQAVLGRNDCALSLSNSVLICLQSRTIMTDYEARDFRIALTGTQFSWKKLVYQQQSLAVSGGNKVDKVSIQLEAKLLLATASSSSRREQRSQNENLEQEFRVRWNWLPLAEIKMIRTFASKGFLEDWLAGRNVAELPGSTFLREIVPWRKLHQKRCAIRT